MQHDIVFSEHYEKKFNAALQQVGQDAFNQGFGQCLAIIDHFNKMEMPVTVKNIELFMTGQKNMEMRKAEARAKAKESQTADSNPCGEIPLPTEPKRAFEVVK